MEQQLIKGVEQGLNQLVIPLINAVIEISLNSPIAEIVLILGVVAAIISGAMVLGKWVLNR